MGGWQAKEKHAAQVGLNFLFPLFHQLHRDALPFDPQTSETLIVFDIFAIVLCGTHTDLFMSSPRVVIV